MTLPTTDNRIREWRQKRGWSLQQLADAIGTSKSQVDKLEKGTRRLTVEWMVRLATPLDCDPRELMVSSSLAALKVAATSDKSLDLKAHIRAVPDFPKIGILFYDISTLLAHGEAWRETVARMAEAIAPHRPDVLLGIESRGFLVAAPVAAMLGIGLVMVRKPGKLPGNTIKHSYDLEYGSDTLEMQTDAIQAGQRVVVMDDLLATGGTAAATVALARKMGATVAAAAFVIELEFLQGRERLDVPVSSLVKYEK